MRVNHEHQESFLGLCIYYLRLSVSLFLYLFDRKLGALILLLGILLKKCFSMDNLDLLSYFAILSIVRLKQSKEKDADNACDD